MLDFNYFFHSLDNLGEEKVRKKLALRAYNLDEDALAREWLRLKEAASRAEASAYSAKKSAWIAVIAAFVAAIALILSVC